MTKQKNLPKKKSNEYHGIETQEIIRLNIIAEVVFTFFGLLIAVVQES